MTNSESEVKKNKGFAGLDSMVSDISAIAEDAPKSGPQKTLKTSDEKSSHNIPLKHSHGSVNPSPQQTLSPKDESVLTIRGWTLLVTASIIIIILIILLSSNKKTSAPHATPSANASPPSVETAANLFAPVPMTPEIAMPPVGHNLVLNVAQIRYCKTEKIRIDAFESVINNEYQNEVDRFNEVVNDYNSRCGAFRYRRGDVERAQREIDPMRESITAAAKSEWVRHSLGLQESVEAVPSNPVRAPQSAPTPKSSLSQSTEQVAKESLNNEEKASIESACSSEKVLEGPAAYNKCVSQKISSLNKGPRNIDLSKLSLEEKSSIESACSSEKVLEGPAAYNKCVSQKISSLNKGPRNIDLSKLSLEEKSSIESACSSEKVLEGPAAYNKCLIQKLRQFKR